MGETPLLQPADRRHRAGDALRQQPAQPPSGSVGARHPVLHQAGAENRHRPVRVQADLPERDRHRERGSSDRPHCGLPHHSAGRGTGAAAENGPGHGPSDLHRQFHLRGGGRPGRGTRREKQALQGGRGRFHRRHLRHAIHVPVSGPVPGRNAEPDDGTDGPLYRSHPS